MSKVLEIRWHGRGGQGAKTAALMLAETVAQTGKYVQGFPEYGPERMEHRFSPSTELAIAPFTSTPM